MEIWKDINGFEGIYQISNFGVRGQQRRKTHKGFQWAFVK